MQAIDCSFVPTTFAELSGWESDDHCAAYETFRRSCPAVLRRARAEGAASGTPPALLEACGLAMRDGTGSLTSSEAKAFFEDRFEPHRVVHSGAAGLLTAYYEPVLDGARHRSRDFTIPVYRRPSDLVNVVEEAQRGMVGTPFTHMRRSAAGFEPYFTREEIESGALEGRNLELLWLKDPVETFMMHVQGSGRIRFADGSLIRITYDGKNGYPYTSVGRHLAETGQLPSGDMPLEVMKDWLKADAARGRKAMHRNQSFIFFRELHGPEAESAMGVMDIPLTDGRSLAVDTAYHEIGIPVWVDAPQITHATAAGGFHRLMIAQDVGSAIKGPERGDIYLGSGDEAGRLAGVIKHPGRFYVLLARPASGAVADGQGKPTRQARP